MKTGYDKFLPAALMLLLVTRVVAVIPIPAEGSHVRSLNGTWRFKLEQAPPPRRFLGTSGKPIPADYPTNFEAFYLANYREDAAWHDLAVLGNWEMAGFSPATYHQPDNASGFYRLQFAVPGSWKGPAGEIEFRWGPKRMRDLVQRPAGGRRAVQLGANQLP